MKRLPLERILNCKNWSIPFRNFSILFHYSRILWDARFPRVQAQIREERMRNARSNLRVPGGGGLSLCDFPNGSRKSVVEKAKNELYFA